MNQWKFKVVARNGKTLGATMTMKEAEDMVEFYERNEPDYRPCTFRPTKEISMELKIVVFVYSRINGKTKVSYSGWFEPK